MSVIGDIETAFDMWLDRCANSEESDRVYERLDALKAAVDLGAAWAEAEAALPEGWVMQGITPVRTEWEAIASSWTARAGDRQDWTAGAGPTPAAALRALAAKLREARG